MFVRRSVPGDNGAAELVAHAAEDGPVVEAGAMIAENASGGVGDKTPAFRQATAAAAEIVVISFDADVS